MGVNETGTHAATTDDARTTRYGLGRTGWALWAVIVAMNFFGGMSAVSGGLALAGYAVFCLVGSYVWVRVGKYVLQKLGVLG